MIPYVHQLEMARDALAILREHMLVYLSAEERTGKTLTAILIAENANVQKVLILTKKKALAGWHETLEAYRGTKDYTVTNYHQAWKLERDYDLVILDECHNYISAYPKIGATAAQRQVLRKEGKPNVNIYDAVRYVCFKTPIVYLSATPCAQGYQMLYHQFSVSSWSPWRRYDSFYRWFDKYGVKNLVTLYDREVMSYKEAKKEAWNDVKHLFLTRTRKEVGHVHEPVDKIHWISLSDVTKALYNKLLVDKIIQLDEGLLVCETLSKERMALHALEGGTVKIDDQAIVLDNNEKVDYLKENFGDDESLVIMYNFQAEKIKLEKSFKKALILQATSYAEGVALHEYDTMVIYSQDYSTARHTQRRARQCNKERDSPIIVHHLLVKDAISHQVYDTVCENKQNFVDSVYKRNKI